MKTCGTCKYFGFKGLVKWCRHPKHVKPLPKAGASFWCKDWLKDDVKRVPGIIEFPTPVSLSSVEDLNGGSRAV